MCTRLLVLYTYVSYTFAGYNFIIKALHYVDTFYMVLGQTSTELAWTLHSYLNSVGIEKNKVGCAYKISTRATSSTQTRCWHAQILRWLSSIKFEGIPVLPS